MNTLTRILLLFTLVTSTAHAQLTIEITQGVEGALPIAIVPFGNQAPGTEDIAQIVSSDLGLSGRFSPLDPATYGMRPTRYAQIAPDQWKAVRADYVVVGEISRGANGYNVQFQLADILQNSELLGLAYNVPDGDLRRVAHQISNAIYEKLTGEKGPFNSRVAYVSAIQQPGGGTYTLVVADADGHNPHTVLRSTQPLLSPAWSPNGEQLAYVSFEDRRAQIVVQNIYSGARQTIAAYPGINGAPSWSPDGRRLAFTLSKDGNPEIYVYDLGSGALSRLTNNTAIDTEPVWTPDGSIVFTSDRGGTPQIYRMSAGGGQPTRLTFEGDYNARPSISPDGRQVAMVHRRDGRFYIAVMSLGGGGLRILTRGGLDESPSFAPNGGLIIYATKQGGRGVLAAVSTDGRIQQSLVSRDTDVREPAWSPAAN